jgi:hypothetical protein
MTHRRIVVAVAAVAALSCLRAEPLAAEPIRLGLRPMTADSPTPAATARLLYYGGRVLSHVQVVQVLWGASVPSAVATGLAPYYQAILQSPYVDWLGEYDTMAVATGLRAGMGTTMQSSQVIRRGTFISTVMITPHNTGTALADADVFAELTAQIDAGVLPPPSDDGHGGYRTIYMIDFPPGVQVTDPTGGQTCVVSCAYHSAGVYKGKNLAFGIHPDITQAGCATGCNFANDLFKSATTIHSHELVEAITDPDIVIRILQGGPNATIDYPVGWFADNNGNEIGDICNGQPTTQGAYTVQLLWSNAQGACISSVSNLPACVDLKPGACGPCTGMASCSGATPDCATSPDFKAGDCVHCLAGTECSGATPTCDKSTSDADDICRACAANTDCAAPTPKCATTAVGSVAAGSCVQCLVSADCTNMAPVCGPAATCTGCTKDSDCTDPMNPHCDSHSGSCGPKSAGCCSASGSVPLEPAHVLLAGLVAFVLAWPRGRRRARRR